jgi:centromere protein I
VRRLVDLLSVKSELDQTSCTTLVKNLYPAGRLPSDVLLTAVGALGHGSRKPAPATQAAIVRWIVLVHDVLDEPSFLLRLYAVLFNLLDLITIR